MFDTSGPKYSEDYRSQSEDELDEDQPDSPHGNLDEEVHRIAANLRRHAKFCSCINDIEAEDEYTTLVKSIWGQLRCFAQKPFVREVAIIAVVLLLKTSLFLAYREASKANIEIGNL